MSSTADNSNDSEHSTTLALEPNTASRSVLRLLLPAICVAVLCLLVRLPFLAAPGYHADQFQNVFWSERAHAEGLDWLYEKRPDGSGKYWCNYPPAYVYVLKGLGTVFDWLAPEGCSLNGSVVMELAGQQKTPGTDLAVWLYKVPAVSADVILAAALAVWLGWRFKPWLAAIPSVLYALSPAVVHNSSVWGQMDAVPTLLMVASLEMARRRKILWMVGLATLAALTKAQACILAPVWVLVAIQWMGTDGRRWLASLGVAAGISAVLLLPLLGVLDGVRSAYADAAGYYPFTHLNGFSVWFLGQPLESPQLSAMAANYARDDVPLFLGLSARTIGLIGVLTLWSSVAVLLWRDRCSARSLAWAARVLPLAFFVLATQMHERYLFPAIALWAWAFVPSIRWWLGWILIMLCVTINQLWAWAGPAGEPWAAWCQEVLHRIWLIALPGCWCATALIIVLILAFACRLGDLPSTHDDAGLPEGKPPIA